MRSRTWPIAIALLVLLAAAIGRAESVISRSSEQDRPESEAPEELTRAELWRQTRLAKLDRIVSEPTHVVERAFVWLEEELAESLPAPEFDELEAALGLEVTGMADLPFPDYRDRLYARIGSIRNGANVSVGAHYFQPTLFVEELDLEAFAALSIANYHSYRLRFGRLLPIDMPGVLVSRALPAEPAPFFFYGDARYEYFPQEDFYGLGGDSLEANESAFRLDRAAFNAIAGYRFGSAVTAGFRAGVSRIDVGRGAGDEPDARAVFDPSVVPGLSADSDFFETAATLLLDLVDRPGDPHQGGLVELSFQRYNDLGADALRFNRFAIDLRGFVPLGSPQRVLRCGFSAPRIDRTRGRRFPSTYSERWAGAARFEDSAIAVFGERTSSTFRRVPLGSRSGLGARDFL